MPSPASPDSPRLNRRRSGDIHHTIYNQEVEHRRSGEDNESRTTSIDLEMEELGRDMEDDEEQGLTPDDFRRRSKDVETDSIMPDGFLGADAGKRLADADVLKRVMVNGILIGLWYTFSLSISLVG